MKEFFQMMRRFVSPYKKYLGWAVLLNLLSAVFNIFSFTLLIPILQILFKIDQRTYSFIPWNSDMGIKEVAINNFYYSVSQMIESYGSSNSLLFLGLFLAFMTMLKTSCYFASSAVMIPLRTGVVRDIRIMVYSKVMRLPLRFFSEERKGDIIARMSGDVGEVENSITSSLDMLIKNPILIVMYFGTLLATSWQLTLFTFLVVPGMGWVMGKVGKKLKRQSLEAQGKWSDTMTQLEETLGGLRIIKAFIAEQKMIGRFTQCSNELRDATNRVATRQALAHPMSEFLGTLLIVLVLWFGGSLILGEQSSIDAPTFIFYMVILYSVINPLKEFSKAGYNIPKGLASMERVDKILKAENPIKEIANPKVLDNLNDKIELKNISFSYDGTHQVLKNINITIPKGKTIALVGQSGSGKSTLVDLLPRYNFTFIKDTNFVCILDGGKTVGYSDSGTCLHQTFQSLLNQTFTFRIKSGSRFVKD
jgi:ATP-binding cassette, subfamily B, bacterial MsbA